MQNVEAENVFYCRPCQVAVVSSAESPVSCKECGELTKNIGWFESDGGNKESEG